MLQRALDFPSAKYLGLAAGCASGLNPQGHNVIILQFLQYFKYTSACYYRHYRSTVYDSFSDVNLSGWIKEAQSVKQYNTEVQEGRLEIYIYIYMCVCVCVCVCV
jgi:hypothetical protein